MTTTTLLESISRARSLLEGNVARHPLIMVADAWRSCIRLGDHYLESIEQVVKAADAAVDAEDQQTARRANIDISSAMRQVQGVTGKFYGDFVTGREALYSVAGMFKIPTKRSSPSYGKKPVTLTSVSDQDLYVQMNSSVSGLADGVHKMLNKGAGVSNNFRMAAKSNETPAGELMKALVEDGLDFRDSVSVNVFARTNSVMRRAYEISKRNWELMMLESGGPTGWDAPWLHDPEIGNLEA